MRGHKIKAYTLMEVTITMLISALVISITYTAYAIVSRSYLSFKNKNDDMAVLIRLDELLKKDFVKADTISKTMTVLRFKNNGHTIEYEFAPEYVARTSGITDTFKVTASNLNSNFENQPVAAPADSTETQFLDELRFILIFKELKIPYHYHKQYSSANLIQQNPDALN